MINNVGDQGQKEKVNPNTVVEREVVASITVEEVDRWLSTVQEDKALEELIDTLTERKSDIINKRMKWWMDMGAKYDLDLSRDLILSIDTRQILKSS